MLRYATSVFASMYSQIKTTKTRVDILMNNSFISMRVCIDYRFGLTLDLIDTFVCVCYIRAVPIITMI